MRNKIILVLFGVVFIILVLKFGPLLAPHLTNGINWNRPPAVIFNDAACITRFLGEYQSDHKGHLPSRISELVPNYISYTNINLLFWPKREMALTNDAPEALSKEIDDDGIFVYLGETGFGANLVMYERTNLWSEFNNGIIVDTNLEAITMPGVEVHGRLLRLKR